MVSPIAKAISRDMAQVLVEADDRRVGRIGKCKVVTACYYRTAFEVVATIDTVSHYPL